MTGLPRRDLWCREVRPLPATRPIVNANHALHVGQGRPASWRSGRQASPEAGSCDRLGWPAHGRRHERMRGVTGTAWGAVHR